MRWPWQKRDKRESTDLFTRIKNSNPRKSLTISLLALERRLTELELKLAEYTKMAR